MISPKINFARKCVRLRSCVLRVLCDLMKNRYVSHGGVTWSSYVPGTCVFGTVPGELAPGTGWSLASLQDDFSG